MTRLARVLFMTAAVILTGTLASAETLMMPKRDGLKAAPLVVWGVTTLPNSTSVNPTTYTISFGDGSANASGFVGDRSYIAVPHTYAAAGTYTATLTVVNAGNTEVATVEIRIVDPASLGGGGTITSPVGSGSNELYRNLRINMTIQDGLRYLWTSQTARSSTFPTNVVTSWSSSQHWTALIVAAFENHGYRLPADGSAPTGLYEKYIVQRGLNFIVGNMTTVGLAAQAGNGAYVPPLPARDPCVGVTDSPCIGLRPTAGSAGYSIGIAMLPIAASGALNRTNGLFGPTLIRNKSYKEILQRLANTLSWGQIDANSVHRGGWGYNMNDTVLDGSVMGWAILGLMDAEAAGAEVPAWVKTELPLAVTRAWNSNGSFDYNADGNPAAHVYSGLEKAGVGLQGMFFSGEVGSARVDTTKAYISGRWNALGRVAPDTAYWNCGSANNKSCSYSMFNNFKGLKLQNIATLPGVTRAAGPGGIPAGDWHADYQDWFVNNQINPQLTTGGFWSMTFSGFANDTTVNAAIAELILSPVALVLPDADKFATVGLSPATHTAVEGGTHTVTAKAESESGSPVAGATVNFTILTGPNAGLTGTAVTNAAGEATFTYTDAGPMPSYGTDRIQASIGTLLSNIAEMVWTPFNRPPVATDNAYAVDEDQVLGGNVQTDAPADSDPDGDTLTASLLAGPAGGTLVFNADGSFTYTPDANFSGTVSFSYELTDGMLTSNAATVTITVNAVNDPPVADDGAASTTEESPVSGQVTSSDVDGGAPSYSLGNGPASGTAVVNADGTFTYTPNADFCGTDTFTFGVSDGAASDSGTVTVAVSCVNDPPVAADAAVTTAEDTPVTSALSSSDVDGGAPSYSLTAGPSNGTLALNPDGTYTYTPNVNYNGPDSFSFQVSDGAGGTDEGTVSLTVTPVNDAPVCTAAAPSITSIWPPDHRLVNVSIGGVVDPVEGSGITLNVTAIFQDEPTNTIGDGDTPVDGFGVGTGIAVVRAERSGSKRVPGDGRMYYIHFTGTDAEGGTCTGTVKVGVPHDLGQDHLIGEGGPIFSSTGS